MIRVRSPGGPHFSTKTRPHPTNCRLQSWNASVQTTTKIGTQAHPSECRLPKVILSSQPPQNTPFVMALPIRGTRPSSTQETAGTSPSHWKPAQAPGPTSPTRGQTPEARGIMILQPVERRPQTQKVRQNEMTEKYVVNEETR